MDFFMLLFFGVMIMMIISIIAMVISLSKQEDERRQFILNQAIRKTFIIMIGVLMLYIFESVYCVFTKGININGINPFICLFVISLVFSFELLFTKKKYGD